MHVTTRRLIQILCLLGFIAGCTATSTNEQSPRLGAELARDDFQNGLQQWSVELERPGMVRAVDGALEIDVPAGATLWFKPELSGPIAISFEATAIAAGGPHDRVSDMNTFWMARGLLRYEDPAPYTQGWFAIRTVQSHLRIERLRVHRVGK